MIALLLILAMLVSIAPAVVADDTVPKPTVEEILDEYHQKAFEAEAAGETATASTYSRSGSSGKTLEQETVDTLNAAGYEAYNVTAENYEALEAQLKTDFADIGLDPDGSYIIAISGEEPEDSTASGISPRAMVPVDPGGGGGVADNVPFYYTCAGTTYQMRYLTITRTDNPAFFQHDSARVADIVDYSNWDSVLNFVASVFAEKILDISELGTILSILGLAQDILYVPDANSFTLQCAALWTRKYIQIWNSFYSEWRYATCSEYVKTDSTYSGYIYDDDSEDTRYESKVAERTIYSAYYNNPTQMKINAVIGYLEHRILYDVTGDLDFCIGNSVAVTLREDIIYEEMVE